MENLKSKADMGLFLYQNQNGKRRLSIEHCLAFVDRVVELEREAFEEEQRIRAVVRDEVSKCLSKRT